VDRAGDSPCVKEWVVILPVPIGSKNRQGRSPRFVYLISVNMKLFLFLMWMILLTVVTWLAFESKFFVLILQILALLVSLKLVKEIS
jgi:hypothetical protein